MKVLLNGGAKVNIFTKYYVYSSQYRCLNSFNSSVECHNSHDPLLLCLQEDYIVKQVDLLSGFGGAVGLWLGWSALTLGHFLVQTVKTINSVTIFK